MMTYPSLYLSLRLKLTNLSLHLLLRVLIGLARGSRPRDGEALPLPPPRRRLIAARDET